MANLEKYRGFIPRNKFKHFVMNQLVDHYADITFEGTEHLENVRDKLHEKHDVTVFVNHLSNLDAPVLDRGFEHSGYSDISEKLTFMLGMKLVQNPATRQLTDAYDHIVVVPKNYPVETIKEKKDAREIIEASVNAVKKAKEEHRMIVIFSEGSRSREGSMKQGISEAASYVRPRKGRESYVLPVGLDGTYEMYPPGQKLPRKGDVYIRVGELIDVATIEAPSGKDRKQGIVDRLMTEVARLLPEEKRGFYASYVV